MRSRDLGELHSEIAGFERLSQDETGAAGLFAQREVEVRNSAAIPLQFRCNRRQRKSTLTV
jgi:hypothetical protein